MSQVNVEPEELLLWVDGALDPARADEVSLAVQEDASLTRMADELRASELPYKEAMNTFVSGVPQGLRDRVGDLLDESESPPRASGLKVASLVACMAVTSVCGYLVGSGNVNTVDPSAASLGFAGAVANYQTFYVRETVEGASNNIEAVSQRLLEQAEVQVQVPDLTEQGYEFLRMQQLAFDGEPVVQLVYLAEEGLPVALCYMPFKHGATGKSDAVVFANHFGLNTVEWTTANHRFVMVSDRENDHLKELYQSAVSQWQG